MTPPGKGDTKKGHRLPIPPPTHNHQKQLHPLVGPSSSSLPTTTLPHNLIVIRVSRDQATSMLPTPTRVIVKALLKTLLQILLKLWRWASSFLVLIFLAAWFYGGILPYFMFIMALLSLGYNLSDYLLYQPDYPPESRIFVNSPSQFGMNYFEELWIQTKDRVKLHAYLIKQQVPNSRSVPVMIFFHGNAGNIGSRLENARMINTEIRCHVLLVEYRGFGHSEGTPSENGLYLDAQAAFELVDAREDLDSKKIFLFGRSLGGAVVIDLASRCDFRDRVAGVVVENTFTSIPAVARHLFPIRLVRWLPTFCYKNKFDSYSKISSVVCPTLFICGTEDEMIPESQMTALYNKSSSSIKRLIRISGGHNDTWLCDKSYPSKIAEFLTESLEADTRSPGFHTYLDNIV